jgi:hypothetical protein
VIARLKSLGRYNNTMIVFTSDNGYMWGEHGLWGKDSAYEEAMRVPFIVLMPGVASRTEASLVLPSLDLGPTIFEKATSATGPGAIWAGVRDGRWKYVRYWNGEEELYALNADPYELSSRRKDATLGALKSSLLARTQQQLGLAILPATTPPNCQVGTSFGWPMTTWGGKAPFSWAVTSGQHPPGLALGATPQQAMTRGQRRLPDFRRQPWWPPACGMPTARHC